MDTHKTESFFIPNLIVDNITCVTAQLLNENKIKGLILDVDNTLTRHGSQNIDTAVLDWLSSMKQIGIPMAIVSNNTQKRIEPFASRLGISFTAMGMKPLPRGLLSACKKLGRRPVEVAVIGDQIFTDILGGNMCKMFTILVKPISTEDGCGFRIKRKLEKRYINRYDSNEHIKKDKSSS